MASSDMHSFFPVTDAVAQSLMPGSNWASALHVVRGTSLTSILPVPLSDFPVFPICSLIQTTIPSKTMLHAHFTWSGPHQAMDRQTHVFSAIVSSAGKSEDRFFLRFYFEGVLNISVVPELQLPDLIVTG